MTDNLDSRLDSGKELLSVIGEITKKTETIEMTYTNSDLFLKIVVTFNPHINLLIQDNIIMCCNHIFDIKTCKLSIGNILSFSC